MITTIISTGLTIISIISNIFISLGLGVIGAIGFMIIFLQVKMRIGTKKNKNKRRRLKMNTVERLLKLDAGKIKTPEKEVKMKLNKLDGEIFTFPCKAVDPEYVAELQEDAIEFKKSELNKIRMYDTKVMTIIEGCPSIFKNDAIMKNLGAITPKDLVKRLLLSGEMDDLKAEIDKLGGYDKEDSEDIKN